MDKANLETMDSRWKRLYKVGGAAALVIVALIPIQMAIFVAFPPPDTVAGYFGLFQDSWLLGLLSLDLLYLLSNILLSVLYPVLRRTSESFMAIALMLGVLGIAAYTASHTAFEMLSLSNQYAAATTEAQRAILLGAGQAMLAIYKGTAFDVYNALSAAALLVIAGVMLRSLRLARSMPGWAWQPVCG